jgi:hypothetical protein
MLEATPSDEGANPASDPELDRLVLEQRGLRREGCGRSAQGRADLKVDVPSDTFDAGDKGSALSDAARVCRNGPSESGDSEARQYLKPTNPTLLERRTR